MSVAWGTQPQVLGYEVSGFQVEEGKNNIYREFVVVSNGTERPTKIGNNNFVMSHCIINHDCQIGDSNILSSGVKLAGWVTVQNHVNLGQNSSVHQGCVLGSYSMVGMQAAVTKHVPPFTLYNPSKGIVKLNAVGMQRNGFEDEEISDVIIYYTLGRTPRCERIQQILRAYQEDVKTAPCQRQEYPVRLAP